MPAAPKPAAPILSEVYAARVAEAKSWLASLASKADAAQEAAQAAVSAATPSMSGQALVDLLDQSAGKVTASSGLAGLNIASETQTISSLLDVLAGTVALTVVPAGGDPSNPAADARLQLQNLVVALADENKPAAQAAVNALAADLQAISGGVSKTAAVGVGVGGAVAGGIAGFVGHAMLTGAELFGGEARETRKRRRR